MSGDKKKAGIGLWVNESGNIISHSKGLNKDQIELLQSLKEGDRLIIWANTYKTKDHEPGYNLKKFVGKPKSEVDEF
jgi:hypothetical protein